MRWNARLKRALLSAVRMSNSTATVAVLACALLFVTSPARAQSLGPNETFAAAGLTAEDVRQIVDAIEQAAYDTPASWSAELRARRVDLGGGPAVVVQGTRLLCGGTGNCQLFVLHKVNGRWVSLFGNEHAPLAATFQFGPGSSHGIKDLTLVTNTSAETGDTVIYQFDGRVYRAKTRQ